MIPGFAGADVEITAQSCRPTINLSTGAVCKAVSVLHVSCNVCIVAMHSRAPFKFLRPIMLLCFETRAR